MEKRVGENLQFDPGGSYVKKTVMAVYLDIFAIYRHNQYPMAINYNTAMPNFHSRRQRARPHTCYPLVNTKKLLNSTDAAVEANSSALRAFDIVFTVTANRAVNKHTRPSRTLLLVTT
jgi:hypothetical protein